MSPEFLRTCVENSWMIVAMPFFVGFTIITCFLFAGIEIGQKRWFKSLSMYMSVGSVTIGFIHSLLVLQALLVDPSLAGYQLNFDWYSCNLFKLSVGFLVDNLTAMMLIVVTTVSMLVQIYTHGYMRDDPGYARFYSYLSLFTGSMLGLVVSTNLFQMYGFWELVGVCSYFLIGFWWYKTSAAEACLKAFVVNRVGDFGFLIGVLVLLFVTHDFWGGGTILAFTSSVGGNDLTGAIQQAVAANKLAPDANFTLTVIALLVFMGPMAKSAQFPLHVWLPDAMEGPTPISALIHAATMVAAGIYLVARAYPIFLTPTGSTESTALMVVACVGTFTAFMAATIALTQYDIKRVLAWSTCSQLGYMFVGLGAGAYSAGLFHLMTHAFFKAMLFLGSGAVIIGLHHEQDIRKMGGLWKPMKMTAIPFLIGCVTISGFPPFSAFFSKDEIVAAALNYNPILGWILIFTAGLTAFYMFRLFFLVFTGEYRGDAKPHEVSPAMWGPLWALAVPSLCVGGMLGFNQLSFSGTPAANAFGSFVFFGQPHQEAVDYTTVMISTGFALAGFAIAYFMYVQKSLNFHQGIVKAQGGLYKISYNKWYIDHFYLWMVNGLILPTFSFLWRWLDKIFVDQVIVTGSYILAMATGEALRYTQTGRGQYYAAVIFCWVAILTWVAFAYNP